MALISFAPSIRSQVDADAREVDGATVREALERVFAENERIRGYVLDDAGSVRKHVAVIVDGEPLKDRTNLSDPLSPEGEIFVMQALSGG